MKIAFTASDTPLANTAKNELEKRYGVFPHDTADVIVALGGDGHVLKMLYSTSENQRPVFAMHRTDSVGFLCNDFSMEHLEERITKANKVLLHPLRAACITADGNLTETIAINEVSLLRESTQGVRLQVMVDGVTRLDSYSGDGMLVATPTGSTAYNHSAGGPILPLEANLLVMTAICGFRPRRWSHAILPINAVTEINVLEPQKRPVRVEAGLGSTSNVIHARIWHDPHTSFTLLYDKDNPLRERIIREQFSSEKS